MADEEKVTPPGQSVDQPRQSEQTGEKSPEPDKPGPAADKTELAPDKLAPPRATQSDKPATPKAAAAKKPSITSDIAGDPFIDKIKERFGAAITEAVETLGQQILRVNRESYVELCGFLHDDDAARFDMWHRPGGNSLAGARRPGVRSRAAALFGA